MDSSEIKQLRILAARSRMGAILGTYHAKSGHPGGSLSAADIFTYLYFKEMNVDPKIPICRTEIVLFFQKVTAVRLFMQHLHLRAF